MERLLFDTDSHGSIAAALGLRPNAFLYDLLIQKLAFRECIIAAHPTIDVICSNRYTVEAESAIAATTFLPHPPYRHTRSIENRLSS